MNPLFCLAFGIGTKNSHGQWLEVFYPAPLFKPSEKDVEIVTTVLEYGGGNVDIELNDDLVAQLAARFDDDSQKEILKVMQHSKKPRLACLLETDSALASTI